MCETALSCIGGSGKRSRTPTTAVTQWYREYSIGHTLSSSLCTLLLFKGPLSVMLGLLNCKASFKFVADILSVYATLRDVDGRVAPGML